MALLEVKDLTFRYPDEEGLALSQVSFTVNQGEFIVLCGPSGSGKSTLLRLLKREIAPHGTQSGDVFYSGRLMKDLQAEQLAKEVGMVFQDPENQLVMDRVMEELVFGMENMGASTEHMRKSVAEIVHFFGLEELLERKTHELSGGQKQLVNLASVLLLEPTILLLDEPTAQLDPVSAKEFIGMLIRMNEEFGLTIIIAEHRLEELFGIADRVIVIDNGSLTHDATPREVIYSLGVERHEKMYPFLPSPAVLYLEHSPQVEQAGIPLTVKQGKQWLKSLDFTKNHKDDFSVELSKNESLLVLKSVDFQYEKETEKILNNLSLTVNEGECLAIVGANGTGKSTLLKVMAGLEKAQRGSVIFKGKKLKKPDSKEIGYLPQNPKLFFIKDTVESELIGIVNQHETQDGRLRLNELLNVFELTTMKNRHPYDLSGGEMQKAALAGVLLPHPKLLLVDEPTKGLDPEAKQRFGTLLKTLRESGITIVMVTHDIEFAAKYATRCAMMFKGEITVTAPSKRFFQGNAFYTTVLNRMTRGSNFPDILTVEEAREIWNAKG